MDSFGIRQNQSELRKVLTPELFEGIYTQFMEQADKNVITKKANGRRIPPMLSFVSKGHTPDGCPFSQHFGQGSASKTPYVSWWVVSVYYVTDDKRIVIGIEEDRYPRLDKMHPIKLERIGKKKTEIAVFYETSSEAINFQELYRCFLDVSEEVMRLGI